VTESESQDPDDIFNSIVENNGLEDWLEKTKANSITIGDIYQGLAILSSMQADMHEYLKDVIRVVFKNNNAGFQVEPLPELSSIQVAHLKQIFESAAIVLEE
jgi:hypothetical protein